MKALTDSFSQPLFFISSTILIIFRGIDMAEIKKITSPQNGTFKTACKWTKPKEARAEGVFLVEGIRWVREILAEKYGTSVTDIALRYLFGRERSEHAKF